MRLRRLREIAAAWVRSGRLLEQAEATQQVSACLRDICSAATGRTQQAPRNPRHWEDEYRRLWQEVDQYAHTLRVGQEQRDRQAREGAQEANRQLEEVAAAVRLASLVREGSLLRLAMTIAAERGWVLGALRQPETEGG